MPFLNLGKRPSETHTRGVIPFLGLRTSTEQETENILLHIRPEQSSGVVREQEYSELPIHWGAHGNHRPMGRKTPQQEAYQELPLRKLLKSRVWVSLGLCPRWAVHGAGRCTHYTQTSPCWGNPSVVCPTSHSNCSQASLLASLPPCSHMLHVLVIS